MNKHFTLLILLLVGCSMAAQVGVNTATPDPSAILDVFSTDKGALLPRLSDIERSSIPAPIANGLVIFNTTENKFQYYSAGTWFNLATEVNCDIVSYPSQITVILDKGTSTSFTVDFAATIGTPGNITTSLFTSSSNLDVTLNSVTNNSSPAPVSQNLDITLLNSSTAIAGDTGSLIFQATTDCGVTQFFEVKVHVTGCDFSITPDFTTQSITVPASGTNNRTFNLDIDQLGTDLGTISSITSSANAGFTVATSNVGCSYDCEPSITFLADTTVLTGTYTFTVDVTSSCGTTNTLVLQILVEAVPRDCKQILSENPTAASGVYSIDPDGTGSIAPLNCECDMATDGGGWTMVANYNHRATTNPGTTVRTTSLPIIGSNALGTGEEATAFWGHASNTLLSNFNFTTVRFYGITSNHGRVLHFKHTQQSMVDYFKTGIGGINNADLSANFSPLTGHSANSPGLANNNRTNRGDFAMIDNPFYRGNNFDWNAGIGNDWEMDDNNGGPNFNTLHRIWIR